MDDLTIPEFIDLNEVDLSDLELNDSQKEPSKEPQKEPQKEPPREYNDDIAALILKTTLLNHLALIQEINDSDDKTLLYQMINNFKNMLILHGRVLNKNPRITESVENYLYKIQLDFSSVIYKMIDNIRNKKYSDNLYFRDVNANNSNTPPIPVEQRKLIESGLPQFKYSRQIKKPIKPFVVNQIVGAKDKENKWWLSRILHVHEQPDSANYWYYVRFEGWGALYDEWINSKTYRVRAYNPRKHFLKR